MPANERRIMLQNITHIGCGLAAGKLAREAACFIAHNFADDADGVQEKNQTYNSFQCRCRFSFFFSFFGFGLFCVEQRNQCKGLRLTTPSTSPRTPTTHFPAEKIRFVRHKA
jgi:hypothetical protein